MPSLENLPACREPDATRVMLDAAHRRTQMQAGTELARQIVGQRMHGLAEEILQLGNLVGDAAVVVDQVPQRHTLDRLAPQTFDH